MTDITQELKRSLRKQRRELAKTFAVKLHPTASMILDEGAKVIIAGGSGALTMRAVAKQARIKLASLQYHFKTFDQLISALFSREFGSVADLIWSVFQGVEARHRTPVEALRAAVESFMPNDGASPPVGHRIYFHLLAFSSYNRAALSQAKAFYKFYNTLIACLISQVNPSLVLSECMARATIITSTLEGSCIYTIMKVGGAAAERIIHQEIGGLTIHYAGLPGTSIRGRPDAP